MKTVISINSDIKDRFEGDLSAPSYGGTRDLYNHFEKRGHEVSFICPDEITKEGTFEREYKIEKNKIIPSEKNVEIEGDIFFMRGFGQNRSSQKVTENFFKSLKEIEPRFGLMINPPESAWFDLKDYQKELNLPFIPSPKINKISDLEEELSSGKKIVAKPNSGFQGRGIYFLEHPNEIKSKISERNINDYSFEYGITGDEPRYLFLDGEILAKRNLVKPPVFGPQETIKLEMRNPYESKREVEIVKEAIKKTKMFYGCVDFKGDYLLEINGSGTNQFATFTDGSNRRYYDFGEKIVSTIEKKLK